jgi:iron complex outermembrane receptor protein
MHNTSSTSFPQRLTLLALAIGAVSQGALAAPAESSKKKSGRNPGGSGHQRERF